MQDCHAHTHWTNIPPICLIINTGGEVEQEAHANPGSGGQRNEAQLPPHHHHHHFNSFPTVTIQQQYQQLKAETHPYSPISQRSLLPREVLCLKGVPIGTEQGYRAERVGHLC